MDKNVESRLEKPALRTGKAEAAAMQDQIDKGRL